MNGVTIGPNASTAAESTKADLPRPVRPPDNLYLHPLTWAFTLFHSVWLRSYLGANGSATLLPMFGIVRGEIIEFQSLYAARTRPRFHTSLSLGKVLCNIAQNAPVLRSKISVLQEDRPIGQVPEGDSRMSESVSPKILSIVIGELRDATARVLADALIAASGCQLKTPDGREQFIEALEGVVAAYHSEDVMDAEAELAESLVRELRGDMTAKLWDEES